MRIWNIIFIVIITIIIYEFIIRPFIIKREIRIIENKINQIISLIQNDPVVDTKSDMKDILNIYQFYKKTDFRIPWIWLQLHTMQLMYSCMVCILQLTSSYGVIFSWGEPNQDISILSKRKKELELTLKNLLIYINELDEE